MQSWKEFQKFYFNKEVQGISIDFHRVGFDDNFFKKMEPLVERAYREMAALENGDIANKDENRMVGHYWLRCPEIAPSEEIQNAILENLEHIKHFVGRVHRGEVTGADGRFEQALFIGIGGSALGPQLLCESLSRNDRLRCWFIDNTDPDGIDSVMEQLEGKWGRTLVVVTSKSGSTPEPRNAMKEVMHVYEKHGYDFARHAIAITGKGSLLEQQAASWIDRFEMWNWVGGRTSIFSAVGLVPAALQGRDILSFLAGARDMDSQTRRPSPHNLAMLLALYWYLATDGKGQKDMVIIPYKDRLISFSKYLQQLIMESLGKRWDKDGQEVRQGITVYGNKGSTDQHAYIQQLRDGCPNFFLTVIDVLKTREGPSVPVDDQGMTSGDYLHGFALGTLQAIADNGTQVLQISLDQLTEYELGALIALYERAVGYYASMIHINAYHQPGVEAGKKAATSILQLQLKITALLKSDPRPWSVEEIAQRLKEEGKEVLIFKLLERIKANDVHLEVSEGENLGDYRYSMK